MSQPTLQQLATALHQQLQQKHWMISVAESCTGGWVGKVLTDMAGSSASFDRGFITYSNQAKMQMLAVQEQTLIDQGAVSEATVKEMVAGTLQHSLSQVALAISGIAGPSGGSAEKPVGTVCIGWGDVTQIHTHTYLFLGDRDAIRQQAVEQALSNMLLFVEQVNG